MGTTSIEESKKITGYNTSIFNHWRTISLFCFVLALTSHEVKSDGTALGWSSDGNTWAFLEEGAAIDERVFFNLIDTTKNTFSKQYKKKISEDVEDYEKAQVTLKQFRETKLITSYLPPLHDALDHLTQKANS